VTDTAGGPDGEDPTVAAPTAQILRFTSAVAINRDLITHDGSDDDWSTDRSRWRVR
jgi:hypothetical protein